MSEASRMTLEQLERRKLIAEIRQMERRWWQKAGILAVLAPVVVGVATFGFNYFNGVYAAEARKIAAERSINELAAAELDQRRSMLQMELDSVRAQLDAALLEVAALREQLGGSAEQAGEALAQLETRLASGAYADAEAQTADQTRADRLRVYMQRLQDLRAQLPQRETFDY